MKTLFDYIIEHHVPVFEGGASGHMRHPIDYQEFTGKDLEDLVQALFTGKIEDITEKIDGTNIQATMNTDGEVVFIRNKGDLNSERGGMTVDDMATKWADKPGVAKTFVDAGHIIEEVFSQVGARWFNPSKDTRRVLNCECVTEGVTNVIPYGSAQVDFHDIWTYKHDGTEWQLEKVDKSGLNVIEKACEKVDKAQITPKLFVELNRDAFINLKEYTRELKALFPKDHITIDEWKKERFNEYIIKNLTWIAENKEGQDVLYERWFNGVKAVNLRQLKQMYEGHEDELVALDKKGYKEIVADIMEPLDELFLKLGNDVIKMCKGMLNDNSDSAVTSLIDTLNDTVKEIKTDPDPETQAKLLKQLDRLERLGGESSINSSEGIVFRYRGRLMKLTGTFAPLNQILGLKKFE